MTKQVKIIGLSINKKIGGLKATELKFDKENRLTVVKGEVGSGKTTLNRAMRLTTQGSSVLTDKNLYGDVDIVTQLLDGDKKIFVGCRSNKDKGLDYFLFSVDENGKKIKDVVIDGKKLTPANYMESMQTVLTWRLDELTSENPTVQRKILLELYKKELEKEGVYFDKNHSKYPGSVIDNIEKAKSHRSYMDMKRKEVGGIADDLKSKGINFETRRKVKDLEKLQEEVSKIKSEITFAETNKEKDRDIKLDKIKLKLNEIFDQIKTINEENKVKNEKIDVTEENIKTAEKLINSLITDESKQQKVIDALHKNLPDLGEKKKLVEFEGKKIISKSKNFEGELKELLKEASKLKKKYKSIKKEDLELNNSELEEKLEVAKNKLESAEIWNKEANSVNAYIDWQEANEEVNNQKKNYYIKLTNVDTGVKGLHICTDEDTEDDKIYLMYDGSYDKKYFNNPKKELRKLSSYSGTQKPMICLLIQNYLLSQKQKTLPYLWIDDVPIDKKTRELLNKMAEELDLWLFVNWTGDFKAKNLESGEILLENGEILSKE